MGSNLDCEWEKGGDSHFLDYKNDPPGLQGLTKAVESDKHGNYFGALWAIFFF